MDDKNYTLLYMLTNTAYLHCREMAEATNFTEDVLQKIKKELSCSPQYNLKVDNELKILSAQNIFLSITAFLGNTLVLVALHREISLHPPSKLLYRNLAITDLCVGIIAETLAVIYWISVVNESWKICYYADLTATFTGNILCAVTLCTLTVKSVDRLFALSLGIRYRDVVTLRRAKITVTVMWVLSIVGASSYFWNPVITLWYRRIGLSLCLVIPTYSYTKIFLSLRHNQVQIQGYGSEGQPSQPTPLNKARYRKAVYSALWVQVALVVCYMPFGITRALTPQIEMSSSVYLARQFASTLAYFNSSLNPLLYCLKIREVRKAVRDTIRDLFCSLN